MTHKSEDYKISDVKLIKWYNNEYRKKNNIKPYKK